MPSLWAYTFAAFLHLKLSYSKMQTESHEMLKTSVIGGSLLELVCLPRFSPFGGALKHNPFPLTTDWGQGQCGEALYRRNTM